MFDNSTDELVAEIVARTPNRAAARELWGVAPGAPLDGLLITEAQLEFVNALLDAPLALRDDQSAYLCEFADDVGETVDD